MFWRSFLPNYVQFSNDGPLGAQNANYLQLPGAFTGLWDDLNSIGANAGATAPSVSAVLRWLLGAVGYSKFFVPITLLIFGVCAAFFFRRLGLSSMACALGALAATLNSCFFSTACWGVASQVVALGMNFLALGFIVSKDPPNAGWSHRWLRYAVAGFAVGMAVVEGADNGAIFSMMIAAFVLYHSLVDEGVPAMKFARGIGRVVVVAVCAAFIAAYTVVALVSTQIQGVAGTEQNEQTKAAQWDWATTWSLPKREALGMVIPGLFGYRMDTPSGGNYWGAMGRDPAWYRYFANDQQGPPPRGVMRFSGGGPYVGVPVVLLAIWAALQAFRKSNSVFTPLERKLLWFWITACVVSLLLAFGRFAPFYKFLYALPYFSTIRNPVKFLAVCEFALLVLFAYGVNGLWRKYLAASSGGKLPLSQRLRNWWTTANAFDKRWMIGCIVMLGVSLIGWLIYSSSRQSFEQYLQTVQFDEVMAQAIAGFSIRQVGWFVLFFVLTAVFMTLVFSGALAGNRARWAGILLGVLVVVDLGRADRPWIVYWNYKQKYASNPIVDRLREKPYEHRVAILPFQPPPQLGLLNQLYGIEWAQHHFPYYNVQSLDVIQQPRVPADLAAFQQALLFDNTTNTLYRIARRWQLTNTRYLLGPTAFLGVLNQQLDPAQHRFRVAEAFDIVPKPGVSKPTRLEELTAQVDPHGQYALFEFTGALPRVKLYTHWQVDTNDQDTLEKLASKSFDPAQTVLVSSAVPAPTNAARSDQNAGTVEFTGYAPKDIKLSATADAPSILLLNDKYDPNWQVWVDGSQAELLRCNFIMRGVFLTAGKHTVEFLFKPNVTALYITLAGLAVWLCLVGIVAVQEKKAPAEPPPENPPPGGLKQKNRRSERLARTS